MKPAVRQLLLGANRQLIANGNFSDGALGWYFTNATGESSSTPSMGVVTNGQMVVTGAGTPRICSAFSSLSPGFTFVTGQTYEITAQVVAATSAPFLAVAGGADISGIIVQNGAGSNTARTARLVWTATTDFAFVGFRSTLAGAFTVDDFSVRKTRSSAT